MRSFFYWLAQEVSPFSWLVAIALDLVWNLADGASIFSGFGVLCYPVVMTGIFGLCFLSVACIQHFIAGDEWKPALNKGLIFGIIAALPFSVVSLVAGGISLLVKGSRGTEFDAAFGRFGLNYRELEKTIKQAALACGGVNGGWRELTMETAINTLERAGRLSRFEARELHELRIARNEAHHAETPANLSAWVDQSAQLLQKYRERFGAV
jgi:hypothetical protein